MSLAKLAPDTIDKVLCTFLFTREKYSLRYCAKYYAELIDPPPLHVIIPGRSFKNLTDAVQRFNILFLHTFYNQVVPQIWLNGRHVIQGGVLEILVPIEILGKPNSQTSNPTDRTAIYGRVTINSDVPAEITQLDASLSDHQLDAMEQQMLSHCKPKPLWRNFNNPSPLLEKVCSLEHLQLIGRQPENILKTSIGPITKLSLSYCQFKQELKGTGLQFLTHYAIRISKLNSFHMKRCHIEDCDAGVQIDPGGDNIIENCKIINNKKGHGVLSKTSKPGMEYGAFGNNGGVYARPVSTSDNLPQVMLHGLVGSKLLNGRVAKRGQFSKVKNRYLIHFENNLPKPCWIKDCNLKEIKPPCNSRDIHIVGSDTRICGNGRSLEPESAPSVVHPRVVHLGLGGVVDLGLGPPNTASSLQRTVDIAACDPSKDSIYIHLPKHHFNIRRRTTYGGPICSVPWKEGINYNKHNTTNTTGWALEPSGRVVFASTECAFCASIIDPKFKKKRCGGCKSLHYCTSICAKAHWKQSHKNNCLFIQSTVLPKTKKTVVTGGGSKVERSFNLRNQPFEKIKVEWKLVPVAHPGHADLGNLLQSATTWNKPKEVQRMISTFYVTKEMVYPCMLEAAKRNFVDVLSVLLKAGADFSGAIDLISGKNPLHFSCERGQEECATLLIETAHSRKDVYAKTARQKMGGGSGGGETCFDLARSNDLGFMSRRLEKLASERFPEK